MHVPAKANALLHWLVLSIHLVFLQHAGQRSVVSCASIKVDKTAEYRRRLDPQPGSDANQAHQKAAG